MTQHTPGTPGPTPSPTSPPPQPPPPLPPQRHVRPLPDQPRRVQGGYRLQSKEGLTIRSWAGRRWMRHIEDSAPPDRLAEGIEFARLGQSREFQIASGRVTAVVQDRAVRANNAEIAIQPLTAEQWDPVLRAMADQAMYAAKLLAGELPVNVEDLFIPLGLRLFPAGPEDLKPRCDCADESPWCRHVCCAACLAGEQIDSDPFLMLALRGLAKSELTERLRQRRAVVGSGVGVAAAYTPRPVAGAETPAPPLETCLDEFWTIGPELESVDTPLRGPEVNHALLRRLGPSPFEARFPLVGLLATCYDSISQAALALGDEGAAEASDTGRSEQTGTESTQ